MTRGVPGIVLVVLALLVLLAIDEAAAAEPTSPVGQVEQFIGAAWLQRSDDGRGLAVGEPVFLGDRLVTGADGRVRIAFADGSKLAVGSASEVIIRDYATDPTGTRLSALLLLLTGIVRTTVRAPTGDFHIGSRAAVAAVRSTELLMQADLNSSAVFVAVGTVEVQSVEGDFRALLGAGDGIDITIGKPLEAPRRWGEARIANFLARTAIGE
jgi:ferric-dicitrate binding protein FerR (iron transport regulator)